MFYYVIYNSSLTEHIESEGKIMTTILYGTIIYIVLHAYFSSSSSTFISNLKYYFWIILLLDIGFIYYTYHNDEKINDWVNKINDLKGKINDVIKNNNDNTPKEKENEKLEEEVKDIKEPITPIDNNTNVNNNENNINIIASNNIDENLSTPISNLRKQTINNNDNNNNMELPAYVPRGESVNDKYNDDSNKKNILSDFDKLLNDRNKDLNIPVNKPKIIPPTPDFQNNNFGDNNNGKSGEVNFNMDEMLNELDNDSGSDYEIDINDFNSLINDNK